MDRGRRLELCFFNDQKAFDFVDHCIIVAKLKSLDISHATIKWITDFLTNRQQRVKLGKDCCSEWGNVPAAVPQGTKLGPWLFALMINDLNTTNVNDEIKFVDDLTISESVFASSQIQDSVTKIHHKKHQSIFPPIQVYRVSQKKNGVQLQSSIIQR